MDKYIYHYTTVDSVKKILTNKTIRLNRLDRVDDKTESESFRNVNLAKYLFISSWTKEDDENLSLWNEYANNKQGVRIGLPEHMFKLKYVNANMYENQMYNGIKLYGENYMILSPEEVFTEQYEILSLFQSWDSFFIDVKYVDDISSLKKYVGEISSSTDGIRNFLLRDDWLQKAVGIKNKIWHQQNESRFVLVIFPSLPIIKFGGYSNEFLTKENIRYKMNSILQGKSLPIDYFDLDLSTNAINNIEITFGALCSKEDKDEIITLAKKSCENPIFENSILTNQLRQHI